MAENRIERKSKNKKYNCMVCSPRCSLQLHSTQAMMTQDYAQCIMKSPCASQASFTPCAKFFIAKDKIKMTQQF